MSTAFFKTAFSSSSPIPTANNWNVAALSGSLIGLSYPTSLAYGNSVYVAVGVGGYNGVYPQFFTTNPIKYTANTSLSWSNTTTNVNNINFTRVRFLNSKFLAVGFNSSGSAYVYQSTDGNTWTGSTIYTGASEYNYPTDIAWNGTNYVVSTSGSTSIYRSSDLSSWTTYTLGSSNFIRTITYAAGLFVAPTSAYYAWTSSDGATWTLRNIDLTANGASGWYDIIYANSKFVAVGAAYFAVSSDGITWTTYAKATAGATFYAITYALSKYIAVGNNNGYAVINTSSDGVTWTAYTFTAAPQARGVIYDGSQVFVICYSGSYITSTNTTSWTESSSSAGQLRALAVGQNSSFYGAGKTMFVAGGSPRSSGQNATVLYSYDGLSWDKGTITGTTFNQNQEPIWAIIYSNGTFITNTGLRSTDGINWSTTSSYLNNSACLVTTSVTNLLYASRGFFNGSLDYNIYKSTDNAVTWNIDFTNGSSVVGQMAFGSGRLVAISPNTNQVLVNPNLSSGWYPYSLTVNSGSNIVYGNGKFYVLTGTTYATSTDGTSWSTGTITLSAGSLESSVRLSYKNGLYILATGGNGFDLRIFTSSNGIAYTLRYSLAGNFNVSNTGTLDIMFNPTTLVAIANDTSVSPVVPNIYFSTS